MLKNMLNIEGVQELNRKTQQSTHGGQQIICLDLCENGLRRCIDSRGNLIWIPC
jgi:hypothetical protein